MKYHSTENPTHKVSLREAVFAGVAPDGGLYLPDRLPYIPKAFFNNVAELSLPEIGYVVADTLFGEDFESRKLKQIIFDTLNFDIPLRAIDDNVYVLELFHGPTLAINDISARFMSRLIKYMLEMEPTPRPVKILASTSGDTGVAVANAFRDVPGVETYVLYPRQRVGRIRLAQLTSLGGNVHPIEVDGSSEKCRELVNMALDDPELSERMTLTSGNSMNIARFLPQVLYFFWAYSQLITKHGATSGNEQLLVAVPRGNLGNVCAAITAMKMGLPISRIITSAHNGDPFSQYLDNPIGHHAPRIPRNMARLLSLVGNNIDTLKSLVSTTTFSQEEIESAIAQGYNEIGYLMSPKTANTWLAMRKQLRPGETGIILATNHPAKFREDIRQAAGIDVSLPDHLTKALRADHHSIKMPPTYSAFKKYLLTI